MPPRQRLRCKTAPYQRAQVALAELPDFAAQEAPSGRKQIYLVTFPHPQQRASVSGVLLAAPGSLSHGNLRDRVLDACASPIYVDPMHAGQGPAVPLQKLAIFREFHQPTSDGQAAAHYHVAVQASRQFGFMPVKRALLNRHHLASHWSTSHDGYWSAVRYCAWPSESKPEAALDPKPLTWSITGEHPALDETCHEPLTAVAIQRRRVYKDKRAAEEGKRGDRVTELDVWPIVVRNNFRNTADFQAAHLQLIDYAKKHASTAMQAFLFKNRQRLSALIDDVWQWEVVEEVLEDARRSRLDCLQAAATSACACEGKWAVAVTEAFALNGVAIDELCRAVVQALAQGRGETTPVVVLAGASGGEGKSLFLKALRSVFGDAAVFSPAAGNFPMLGVERAKVVLLDEWRFHDAPVPCAVQNLWFDGSKVPITRPQNIPGVAGHFLYCGSAPIFVTTKLSDVEALDRCAQPDASGRPKDSEASMLRRRLKVFDFTVRIPKPPTKLQYCKRCFAQLVLHHGVVDS